MGSPRSYPGNPVGHGENRRLEIGIAGGDGGDGPWRRRPIAGPLGLPPSILPEDCPVATALLGGDDEVIFTIRRWGAAAGPGLYSGEGWWRRL